MASTMKYAFGRSAHRVAASSKKALRKVFGRQRIIYQDHFTLYLKFANAGMLEPGNVYLFDYAIRNLANEGAILEIGSFAGLSTNLIIYFLQKHNKPHRFFTVDTWKMRPDETLFFNGKCSFSEYNEFVKDSYRRNVSFFSPDRLPCSVQDMSVSFFEKWRREQVVMDVFGKTVRLGGALSFCYIDGDHAQSAVRLDFRLCDEYLIKGGFLLFDDCSWDHVKTVMHEILATGRYKLVMRNPNYLIQRIS